MDSREQGSSADATGAAEGPSVRTLTGPIPVYEDLAALNQRRRNQFDCTDNRDPIARSIPTAGQTGVEAKQLTRGTVEITIAGKTLEGANGESWLAGKLLEHAVALAERGMEYSTSNGRGFDATITVGDRTATVKVGR
jgi:hypothetical protein